MADDGAGNIRVEWRGRASFAEAAEAIGIETSDIMAAVVLGDDEAIMVFYTTDTADLDSAEMWRVQLRRGPDGVLLTYGKPEPMPGELDELRGLLEP